MPRTTICPNLPKIVHKVSPVINEAWEKKPQAPIGALRRPRSTFRKSRTSTITRAASLEKLHRTGSSKINNSEVESRSGMKKMEKKVGQR